MLAKPGKPAAAGPNTASRFIAGDPLRGLAALAVFVFHATTIALSAAHYRHGPTNFRSAFGDLVGPWIAGLAASVYVFFALSGYLIGRPFVQAFVLGRRPPSLSRYLRNRVLRIIPAYWAVLAIVLVWTGAGGGSLGELLRAAGLSSDWSHTHLQGYFGQAWTLNVEVRFYLAVAIAGALALLLHGLSQQRRSKAPPRPILRARWLMLACVAVGVSSIAWAGGLSQSELFAFPAEAWAFVPGLLLAVSEVRFRSTIAQRPWIPAATAAVFAVGVVFLAEFDVLITPQLHHFAPFVGKGLVRLLNALGVSAVIGAPLVLQWSGGGCWRLLDNPVLRWLGSRSYSFYLLHYLLLIKLSTPAASLGAPVRSTVTLLALGLGATAAGAELLHRLVERPFLRRKARLQPPLVPAPGGRPVPVAK